MCYLQNLNDEQKKRLQAIGTSRVVDHQHLRVADERPFTA